MITGGPPTSGSAVMPVLASLSSFPSRDEPEVFRLLTRSTEGTCTSERFSAEQILVGERLSRIRR
jgi:hypothetical protein